MKYRCLLRLRVQAGGLRLISSMTAMATAETSGPPPKVVPCMPGVMAAAARSVQSMAPMGRPPASGLAIGDDVGQDAEVLVAEPLAGASEAALDLVGDEEGAGGVAEFAGGGEELLRDGVDAALALDGLDADAADCSEPAEKWERRSSTSLKRYEFDVGHDRREGTRGRLELVGGGDRAHGAAVEAVFEAKELGAERAALLADVSSGRGRGRASARLPRLRCRCWRRRRGQGR